MIKSACRLRRCERGSCSVPVKIQLAIGHPEKTGMKAGLATQKPDDSISRSRLMLFLSEVSEPAERPSIPDKLLPAIMKHFLLIRPRHNQQISFYRSRENNHGCHDLEGRMNRVD